MRTVLEVQRLKKYYQVKRRAWVTGGKSWIRAVDGIDFSIGEGETVSLVGESGCGKTTTTKLILLLEKPTSGDVLFRGRKIGELRGEEFKSYRRSVQAVFQDSSSSLNPRMRVGTIIAQPLTVNDSLGRRAVRARVDEVLHEVGLDSESVSRYPHEFSGGQRQRISIARALVLNPALVLLDEPVSALDVSIQAQVMNLLRDLQEKRGLSYLLVAHNLVTVRYMSHRVAVMYLGKIVEFAESEELFAHRLHPYTQALFSAALPTHPDLPAEEIILSGEVPSPERPPSGCRFHPRCFAVMPICSQVEPVLKSIDGHWVACHLH